MSETRRSRASASVPLSSPCAACPVAGCGTLVRDEQGERLEPRMLALDPARADLLLTCPCPRQAVLSPGLSRRQGWTLREDAPSPDEREEMNLIAHALVTEQAYQDRRPARPTLTAPDPRSEDLSRAFLASHAHAMQVVEQVLRGEYMQAQLLAERAHAADHAYRLAERAVRRGRGAGVRSGRWANAETFYLDLPVRVDPQEEASTPPGSTSVRHTFEFIALYNEEHSTWEVANSREIELSAGITVGEDGWRQLVDLLLRLEHKPGRVADTRQLIWRDDRGTLTLRPHIRRRFPRALAALEALRRTLRLEQPRSKPGSHRDPERDAWAVGEPEWVVDALKQGVMSFRAPPRLDEESMTTPPAGH